MKRVRRKETIENNNQQRLTRSKKRGNDPFSIIPLDLIVEILLRIPAKSIVRLVLVSKHWSSTIRSKDFTNLYLTRSSARPRLLFAVFCTYLKQQFLQSCSQEDPSRDRHIVDITHHPSHVYGFSPPVRGLICRQTDATVTIGNPSTGQFLTLPRVKTWRRGVFSFFGYDPVEDLYKVLCMTVLHVRQRRGSRVVSEEHQVLTLGAKQKWRMVVCKRPHLPDSQSNTKGTCINGVVYYYAWIKSEGSLISFDVRSEEFDAVKLPEDITCLVNYNGKIALASQSNGTLNLWVLEDGKKQEWSKVSIIVPCWTDLVGIQTEFAFRGRLSTGELIFLPRRYMNPFCFISYDLKENNAKKVVVEGVSDQSASLEVYFDHAESPMFLPNLLGNKISPDWNTTLLQEIDCIAFQATTYAVWKERNGRHHQNPSHSPLQLARMIFIVFRNRLISLEEVTPLIQKWNAAFSPHLS